MEMSVSASQAKSNPALVPVRTRYYHKDYSELAGWRSKPGLRTTHNVQVTVTKPLTAQSRKEINQLPRYPKGKVYSLLSVSARTSPVRVDPDLEQLRGKELLLDAEAPIREDKVYLPTSRVPPASHSAGHSHSKSDLHDKVLHIPSESPSPSQSTQPVVPVKSLTKSHSSEGIDAVHSWSSSLPFSIPGHVLSLQLDLRPVYKATNSTAIDVPEAFKPVRQSSPSEETSAGPDGFAQSSAGNDTGKRRKADIRTESSVVQTQRSEKDQKSRVVVTDVMEKRRNTRSQSLIFAPGNSDSGGIVSIPEVRINTAETKEVIDEKQENIEQIPQNDPPKSLFPHEIHSKPHRKSIIQPSPSPNSPLLPEQQYYLSKSRRMSSGIGLEQPVFQPLRQIQHIDEDLEEPEMPDVGMDVESSVSSERLEPVNREEIQGNGSEEVGEEEREIKGKERENSGIRRKSSYIRPITPKESMDEDVKIELKQTDKTADFPISLLVPEVPLSKPDTREVPSQTSHKKPISRPKRKSTIVQSHSQPVINRASRRSVFVRTRKARLLDTPPPVDPPPQVILSRNSEDSLKTDEEDSGTEQPLPAMDPKFKRGARRNSSLVSTDLQENLTRLFTRRRSSLSGEVRAMLEEPGDIKELMKQLPLESSATHTLDALEEFVFQFAKSLLVSLQVLDMTPKQTDPSPQLEKVQSDIESADSDSEEEGKEKYQLKPDSALMQAFAHRSLINRRASRLSPNSTSKLKSPQTSKSPSIVVSPPLSPSQANEKLTSPRQIASRKSSKVLLPVTGQRRSTLSRKSIIRRSSKIKLNSSSSESEEIGEDTPASKDEGTAVKNYFAGSADFELRHMEMVKKMAEELLIGNGKRRRKNEVKSEEEVKEKEEERRESEEETPVVRAPCVTYDQQWQKEAEENDLKDDVAEKLTNLMEGKPAMLHDFAFSARVNFEFPSPEQINKDYRVYEANDKPDEAGLRSALLRARFYELCKEKNKEKKEESVLEMMDSAVASRSEKYELFRQNISKRIWKEKILRSRSGQEMVRLRAKPLSSFTGLPLPLSTAPLRSPPPGEELLVDGKASKVRSPRERQERIYLRMKRENDLQRFSRSGQPRPKHFRSLSDTVTLLTKVRPGTALAS